MKRCNERWFKLIPCPFTQVNSMVCERHRVIAWNKYQAKRSYGSKCSGCRIKIEYAHDMCETCCASIGHEHDPDEGFTCLSCGHNGFEDIASAAYDRAKDFWKYGE